MIKNPERGEVPREVIEQAAKLAAWYSKARNASRVEVHYRRASTRSSMRGAPTGLVEPARQEREGQPEVPAANGDRLTRSLFATMRAGMSSTSGRN